MRRTDSSIDRKHTPARGREYIWQDDAACSSKPPEDFEYLRTDEPGYKPLTYISKWGKKKTADERRSNQAKLEASAKVCSSCPVAEQCLAASSPADLFWTVRAGQLPKVLAVPMKKAPAAPSSEYIEWLCRIHGRTHYAERWDKSLGRKRPYCRECAP